MKQIQSLDKRQPVVMAVYQFSFVFIYSWDLRDHRDRVVSIADLDR